MNKVYEIVTEKIIEQLEAGTVPWRKPWIGGTPMNAISKRPYSGINVFLLALRGFSDSRWVTYKQAAQLGGNVRRGEKSTLVIFWKLQRFTKKDEAGKDVNETVPLLRYYLVFNVEQCDGLKLPALTGVPLLTIQSAEQIVKDMPHAPVIRTGEPQVYYRPSTDEINIPAARLFNTSEEYYSTLFHELVHSTGHASRLDRHQWEGADHHFGSATYSREELVAEMGNAFLCAVAGIEQVTIANSAAYIASWLKALKNDKTLVVSAAAKAQQAADYILGKRAGIMQQSTERNEHGICAG